MRRTIIDRDLVRKRVPKDSLSTLIGESVYWFCPTCRKWHTSPITPDGIICPACGSGPDWKEHPPVLSYQSRYKRVDDLCAEGSPWREEYERIEQRYGDFIEQTYIGMPKSTRSMGLKFFGEVWQEIDKLADFLLTAPDSPATDLPHAYTARGLQRKYSDPRRKHNVSSLSELNLVQMVDDSGVRLTDQEVVEVMSFHTADSHRFYDEHFPNEFLDLISDPLERSIAFDLSRGAGKRDIERRYGLSERQVRTKVSHISKALQYMNNL